MSVLFTFASGATRELNESLVGRVIGLDPEGRVIVDDGLGLTFGLTLCCNAYDKGIEDGVVCRRCYGTSDIGSYNPEVADAIDSPAPDPTKRLSSRAKQGNG